MQANDYEIIVIGAGHAGCEAALASSRLGLKTLLLTINLSKIALMPCNPSIGGIGKGHLVREIDALGGEMAKNTDKSMIQIKTLNSSKGPAVRALRAQADKRIYEAEMRNTILKQRNLDIRQALAISLLSAKGVIKGIVLASGEKISANAVICTTGTFLNGRVVLGDRSWKAGRAGEQSAIGLTQSLKNTGITTSRFQTATPPRVDGRSLDYKKMSCEPGEDNLYFSFMPPENNNEHRPCFLTYTNEKTTEVVSKFMKHSPIKTGAIEGHGPRYCPSIDRKVINFPDKAKHPVFVEPEGLKTNEMYLQGLTTAMPASIQPEIVRTVKGLEKAHIVRFGYAVEYDYVPPQQLRFTLETKNCENLYLAGQLIGTTGYEEAAALGLMAGINASLKLLGKEQMVLGRHEAYIGVLIDDLITKGVDEPYRMFTSRAEYRLLLRSDNAHFRLSGKGFKIGLIKNKTHRLIKEKEEKINIMMDKLGKIKIKPGVANKILNSSHQTKTDRVLTAAELISRPHVNIKQVIDACMNVDNIQKGDHRLMSRDEEPEIIEGSEIYLKYGGYINRQEADIKRSFSVENIKIPKDFVYKELTSLSFEAREKLDNVKPQTLGQASRIPGVTPADISVLAVYLKQKEHGKQS